VSSVHFDIKWNQTGAALYLESLQEPNGSFQNSVQGTSEVILALSSLMNQDGVLRLTSNRCQAQQWVSPKRSRESSAALINTTTQATTNVETQTQRRNNSWEQTNQVPLLLSSESPRVTTVSSVITKNEDPLEVPVTWNVLDTGSLQEPSPTAETPQFVNVSYWLWIGPDPVTAEKHNITFPVPMNSTFFYVMQRAAELDSDFE